MKDPRPALERLDEWMHLRELRGWDPYDGLSSPLGRRVPGRRPRQVVVQALKRAPTPIRRAARVPEQRLTKTLALVAVGLERAPWLPNAPERRRTLVREILARRGQAAWGYEFDVQTRWGYYPAGSPNAIVTAFSMEAVRADLQPAQAKAVREWLTGPMWTGTHFRYVPGNDTLVHNANVLAARALQRLAPEHPLVTTAVRTTLDRLPAGGLWRYGESPGLEWVDNFHTAYVLDALLDLKPTVPEIDVPLRAAAQVYVQTCFADDGRPFYYQGGTGGVDVHNVASSLTMLRRLDDAGLPGDGRLVGCLEHALSLQRPDGAFVAKPRAVPFMRWNQAHMHRALAEVAR